MTEYRFQSHSEQDTARLGAALAAALPRGCVVGLMGTLGAGKTSLVRQVAAALDITDGNVVSPTFTLINEYHGRYPIYHIDAFRLRDHDEFLELGPEEYFEGDGVVFCEWADRVVELLPAARIDISIEVNGPSSREFIVSSTSPRHAAVVEQLAAVVGL